MIKTDFNNLKTLVVMQLKDKTDLSYLKSPRKTLFAVAGKLGQFVLAGAAFFLFLFLASLLKLFSFTGIVPTTVMTAAYTLFFVLSVVGCTAGLTEALYLSADNRVLLTLPVRPDMVFFSKLILYYIFELKKNLLLLLPMYVSYGIVMGAVWYYYLWLLVCFVFVSLVPVAIGALLSIPALFIAQFVRKYKWLQATLTVVATALIGWLLIDIIRVIPENINIAGQWTAISMAVQQALQDFADMVKPLDLINLMIVGGTSQIRSSLITINTLWGWLIVLGTSAACLGLAYLVAKPLFFKMASKQFEYEKDVTGFKKNKVHSRKLAPIVYETMRSFRSSRFVIRQMVGFVVLPVAVFLMNKLYVAMNTRLAGQYMTIAFSLLISLLIVTAGNVSYASVLSVDGAARPIAKTQPVEPRTSILARLIVRTVVIVLSTIAAMLLWQSVAKLSAADTALLAVVIIFVGLAHLLWSVEMDVMNPQNEQYATVGVSFDNPNERNSTIIGFLISALVAFCMYFIMSEGQTKAIFKIALVALAFLGARVYFLLTRIRLYYAEK